MESLTLLKRCTAEGIGTALLVLIGAGAAAFSGIISANNNQLVTLADIGIVSFAFAIIVIAMIYTFGRISGAHINPAVTVGLAVTGNFPWREVPAYVIAQCIGGVIGASGIVIVLGMEGVTLGGLGAPALSPTTGYVQGIAIEAIGTFILMLVIMAVAVDSQVPKEWAGLVIGLTVGGVIMMMAGATGSSINPARTFGPYVVESLLSDNNSWREFPVYVIGPLIGAITAAFTYQGISREKAKSIYVPHNKMVK